MRIVILSLIFALGFQSSGCTVKATQTVIPNRLIQHEIAQPVKVKVWLRKGKTKVFQEVEMQFQAGWLIVPPEWGHPPVK